ncbi:MAG: TIR domain-containing protein [Dehalococcoidia bacterium]|nr:TIR domain-containing protein [Dehalococcoidia bacterium]
MFNLILRVLRRESSLPGANALGPVFISYRQSDGAEFATDVAWALRAAGVPVWQDKSDLPPGDTRDRLDEALASGLSGAVLLITPEIEHSEVVRNTELPRLLALAKDRSFALSIGSTIERSPGKLDYRAPDRLLHQRRRRLQRFDQRPISTATQRAELARMQCRRRMQALRAEIEASGRPLLVDVQTRIPPFAALFDADLVLRLRPPEGRNRRPHIRGLEDLQLFLADLPYLIDLAGARTVRLRGAAHLSVAYAIGAALPTTKYGTVEVEDTGGHIWRLNTPVPVPGEGRALISAEILREEAEGRDAVLVYVDVLAERSDAAFDALVSETELFRGVAHLRPNEIGNLDPSETGVLVGEISRFIRQFADQHRTTNIDLLLRSPWPVALQLGRALNTMRVRLYEWEDGVEDGATPAPARYLSSLIVRSGTGTSPIEAVLLEADD